MSDRALADVVIPTIGRPSLRTLLEGLEQELATRPGVVERVLVVDDRPHPAPPLGLPHLGCAELVVVRGRARGPAAARNCGWRRGAAPWVVFLDDDVRVAPAWIDLLVDDLGGQPAEVVAVQGRLEVPLGHAGPPNDQERVTTQLAQSVWITADMAVRRSALCSVGGFDERFPRAYREDTDLALRLMDDGGRLVLGQRISRHPVRTGRWTDALGRQRGTADDALMRRLHGSGWRGRGGAPAGLLRDHLLTTVIAGLTIVAMLTSRWRAATALALVWGWRWGRFLGRRRTLGRDGAGGFVGLAITSAVIPPLATWWWCTGLLRARRLAPGGRSDRWAPEVPALVLFDRDGTLIHDVPYNDDPSAVSPIQGAAGALDRLRSAGVAVGMVTNQSGIARGLLDHERVAAVNRQVDELLGPFDIMEICPHGDLDGCSCRKPAPGMIISAAASLGVRTEDCAVVGDIGADVAAALAAGARGVLVPTSNTLPDEVRAAAEVVADLSDAVDLLLRGRRPLRPEMSS